MNLPSFLKTLTTKQYQLTAKQRLMVIAVIGILAILITIYMTTSEVSVQPTVPINNSVQVASKTVLPQGKQMIPVNPVEQTMRDPFARPPEVTNQKNSIPGNVNSNAPGMVTPKVTPNRTPNTTPNMVQEQYRLTGIVSSTDQQLAVIMSGKQSKSYSVNEAVGSYKLVSINQDSVILANGDGKLVLNLEADGQKRGNSSEK